MHINIMGYFALPLYFQSSLVLIMLHSLTGILNHPPKQSGFY